MSVQPASPLFVSALTRPTYPGPWKLLDNGVVVDANDNPVLYMAARFAGADLDIVRDLGALLSNAWLLPEFLSGVPDKSTNEGTSV